MKTTQQNVPVLRFKDEQGNNYPDWEEKTFGDISRVKRGASPRPISSPKWFSENSRIGWVRISDITSSNKYLKKTTQYLSNEGVKKSRFIPKGNMVMSICATIGKPIYTGFDVCIHDGFVVFEGLNVNKEFIYYFLEKMQKRWYRYGQPGTQVNLNSDIVSNEKIRIPNESEQQKIATFLSSVDTKIEQLNNKKALWEQYKKGLMQQLFSQEVRFKDEQGNEYTRWEKKHLSDVGQIITGKTPSTTDSSLWGGCVQFITPSDIREGIKYQRITERFVNQTKRMKVLPPKSIIFTCIASIGKICLSIKPCITNQQINSLVPNTNCDNEFVYYALLNITPRIKSTQATTTLPIINKTGFSKFTIDIPCVAEQQKIATFLSAVDTKIELVDTELKQARTFKKGLLQQMFI